MSKNSLIWIFAMIFLAVLPAAYAQAATSSWFFVIVNALIIGMILFILQEVLVPDKAGKEKTSIWIIILVASVLVAWFYGNSSYIWQGPLGVIFNIKVLVNAVLLAIALYFIVGLLDIKNKLNSTEGKGAFGIMLFIIALVISVKIGNQWIWEQNTLKGLIAMLFGPRGILNPSHGLWIFITTFVLFAFFFSNYLLKEGDKKLNYALALIFAAHLARTGISMSTVVKIGEVFFVLILAQTLKGTTSEKYGLNWFIAIFIVGWASFALTSGSKHKGIIASLVGDVVFPAGKGLFYLLNFVIVVAIGFGIFMLIKYIWNKIGAKQENHEEEHDKEESEDEDQDDENPEQEENENETDTNNEREGDGGE